MAFCPKCGAQLAPDAQFCPKCGTSTQQAAPQPQYQQQYQQYQPQPNYGKVNVDVLPNAESQYTTVLTWVGIAGALLSVVLLFVDKVDGWSINKVWYLLNLVASVCSCLAMVNIFMSLKKGLAGQRVAMPSLLSTNAILNIATNGLAVLTALMVLGASSLSSVRAIGALAVLAALVGFGYFVCFIILAVKLLGAYEGKLKTLALTFIAIPVLGILMGFVALATANAGNVGAMVILFTLIMQGVNIYLYILAHQIFTGRNVLSV